MSTVSPYQRMGLLSMHRLAPDEAGSPAGHAGSILIVFSGQSWTSPDLRVGIELAQQRRAPIALVSVTDRFPLSWCWAVTAGCVCWSLHDEQIAWADRLCRELAGSIGPDLSVSYRVLSGPPHRAAAALLAEGHFSVVVAHARWMGMPRWWAARAWRKLGVAVLVVTRQCTRTRTPTRACQAASTGSNATFDDSAIASSTLRRASAM